MTAGSDAADALDIARQVAAEAAQLLAGVGRANLGQIRTKTTVKDLVTEWDHRCDELISTRLDQLSPDVPRLAEESGASSSAPTATRWVIDPIDGTVNFAHGLPFFAVCISLEREGEPVCGVVHAPALGWELHAHVGGGAFRNGEPLRVSRVGDLGQAVLATGFPYDRATAEHANFREWEYFQRRAGACRRFGCASLDLSLVAAGELDGYWEGRLQPWDVSAGALLVREAGGQVTSLTGGPFVSDSGEAVASNRAIHDQIVDGLAAVARSPRPRS